MAETVVVTSSSPFTEKPVSETSTIFNGCTNRAEAAAFMGLYGVDQRLRGFAMGIVVGAIGAVALYAWAKSKGHV